MESENRYARQLQALDRHIAELSKTREKIAGLATLEQDRERMRLRRQAQEQILRVEGVQMCATERRVVPGGLRWYIGVGGDAHGTLLAVYEVTEYQRVRRAVLLHGNVSQPVQWLVFRTYRLRASD